MKFNAKASPLAEQVARSLKNHPDATVNAEGGVAFRPAAKQELYQRVLTCLFGEHKYYEKADDTAHEIQRLVAEVAAGDPEWVLKLAAYARQAMFLRSVPIYLLVLAADIPLCKPFVRKWTPAVVRRADEPAEVIAAWIARHGDIGSAGPKGGAHAFPNSLKKGIGDALAQFDEYQLSKWN